MGDPQGHDGLAHRAKARRLPTQPGPRHLNGAVRIPQGPEPPTPRSDFLTKGATPPRCRCRCGIGVLEKAVVVEWHAHAPDQDGDAGKVVREAAAPFVAWLVLDEESLSDEVDAVARSLASSTVKAAHGHGHTHDGDCCGGHDHGHEEATSEEHEHTHEHTHEHRAARLG